MAHHRRNYCICSQCGKWFRRNKGIHDMMSYGPIHFCNKNCSDAAEFEAYLEADVGGCYEPHYYDDAEEIMVLGDTKHEQ